MIMRRLRLPPRCRGDPRSFGILRDVEWWCSRRFGTTYLFQLQGLSSSRLPRLPICAA